MRAKSPGLSMKAICCSVAQIDEEYTRRPFYGSRKMVVFLKTRVTPSIASGYNA